MQLYLINGGLGGLGGLLVPVLWLVGFRLGLGLVVVLFCAWPYVAFGPMKAYSCKAPVL